MSVADSFWYNQALYGTLTRKNYVEEFVVDGVKYVLRKDQGIAVFDNQNDSATNDVNLVSYNAFNAIVNDYDFFTSGGKLFQKRIDNNIIVFDRVDSDDGSSGDPLRRSPVLSIYPHLEYVIFGTEYGVDEALRGVFAYDVIDGDITGLIQVSGLLPGYSVGEHEIYYTVSNSRGITSSGSRTLSVYVGAPSFETLKCGYLDFSVRNSYFQDHRDGDLLLQEEEEEIRSNPDNFVLQLESGELLEREFNNISNGYIETAGDALIIPFVFQLEHNNQPLLLGNQNFSKFEILQYDGEGSQSKYENKIAHNLNNAFEKIYPKPDSARRYFSNEDVVVEQVPAGYYNIRIINYLNGRPSGSTLIYANYAYVPNCNFSIDVSAEICQAINFSLGEGILVDSNRYSEGLYAKVFLFEGDPFQYIPFVEEQEDDQEESDYIQYCIRDHENICLTTEQLIKIEPEGYFVKPEQRECVLTEHGTSIDITEEYISTNECLEKKYTPPVIIENFDELDFDENEIIRTETSCDEITDHLGRVLRVEGWAKAVDCLAQEIVDQLYNESLQIGSLSEYPIQTENSQKIDLGVDGDFLEFQGSLEISELETEEGFYLNDSTTTIAFDYELRSEGITTENNLPLLTYNHYNSKFSVLTSESLPEVFTSESFFDSNFSLNMPAGRYKYIVHIYNEDHSIIRSFEGIDQVEVEDCSCIQIEEGLCLNDSGGNSISLDISIVEEIFQQDPCALMIEEDFGNLVDINSLTQDIYIETEREEKLEVGEFSACTSFELSEEAEKALSSEYLNSLSASIICEPEFIIIEGYSLYAESALTDHLNENIVTQKNELAITTENCSILQAVKSHNTFSENIELEFA